MEDIKEIIAGITQKRFKHEIEGLKFFERWNSIVGIKLAEISKPAFIRNEILIVHVDSSSALQEMAYNKQNILNNIRSQKDLPYIRDIKFTVK
ncbi:MAG: DUF721 domain-containing protein [bacterium]